MSGINKRSNNPRVDQNKLKVNPAYNTSGIIKAVGDIFKSKTEKRKK